MRRSDPSASLLFVNLLTGAGKLMSFCISCGTELPREGRFCSSCGTPATVGGDEATFASRLHRPINQPPRREREKGATPRPEPEDRAFPETLPKLR